MDKHVFLLQKNEIINTNWKADADRNKNEKQ
jgi:hypothetical protein